jgi:8-oxo-dGTP diphosphatase
VTKVSEQEIHKLFGNRLRIRVCGILIRGDEILVVGHRGLGSKGYFWAPPGGGMEFGSSAEENLIREFSEETGLEIKVKRFLFVQEVLAQPLHALELFFEVEQSGGSLITGQDPEMQQDRQIIDRVCFRNLEALKQDKAAQLHQILENCQHPAEILSRSGYLKFENKSLK